MSRRQDRADSAVLAAIDALRPEHCGPLNIARLSGLRWMRASLALVRLTNAGVIEQATSPFDVPHLVYRRRVIQSPFRSGGPTR